MQTNIPKLQKNKIDTKITKLIPLKGICFNLSVYLFTNLRVWQQTHHATAPDFDFRIAEIELLVENESEINLATEKIRAFAKVIDLPLAMIRGKVVEYMRQHLKTHYAALVKAGVIWQEE